MGTSQSAVARSGGRRDRASTLERYAAAIGSQLSWQLARPARAVTVAPPRRWAAGCPARSCGTAGTPGSRRPGSGDASPHRLGHCRAPAAGPGGTSWAGRAPRPGATAEPAGPPAAVAATPAARARLPHPATPGSATRRKPMTVPRTGSFPGRAREPRPGRRCPGPGWPGPARRRRLPVVAPSRVDRAGGLARPDLPAAAGAAHRAGRRPTWTGPRPPCCARSCSPWTPRVTGRSGSNSRAWTPNCLPR